MLGRNMRRRNARPDVAVVGTVLSLGNVDGNADD
jgi:hypothetical protein